MNENSHPPEADYDVPTQPLDYAACLDKQIPVNSLTGKAYFSIDEDGWGTGWSANRVQRKSNAVEFALIAFILILSGGTLVGILYLLWIIWRRIL